MTEPFGDASLRELYILDETLHLRFYEWYQVKDLFSFETTLSRKQIDVNTIGAPASILRREKWTRWSRPPSAITTAPATA
jgi:hypothetical protein